MSLINEALRKAQGDTSGKVVQAPVSEKKADQDSYERPRPSHSHRWMSVISLIVAISCLGLVLAAWFSKGDMQSLLAALRPAKQPIEHTPVHSKKAVTSQTVKPTPAKPVPAVDEEHQVAQSQEASVADVQISAKPSIPPAEETMSPPTSDDTAAFTKPLTEPASITRNQPHQDPVIIESIYELKIAAVIGHGNNTRIMIEGQVYRVGEMIDYTLQYRLTGEKNDTLFFTDPNGIVYEKHL